MTYSSRFWLYAPLCLFLALAAWVAVHWWNVASAFDKKLDAMKGHEAIPGIVVDWRSKTLSGFPFRLDVMFDGLSVKGEGVYGPFAWTSDKFAMHALTYGREQQIFEGNGQQSLSWTDETGGAHRLSFLPAQLRASAISSAQGLARFDLDILDASGKDTDGNPLTADRLQLHMRRNVDALDLAATAEAADNDGARIRNLRIYHELTHGSAFADLLRGKASWRNAHSAWRKQGGEAIVKQFRVDGQSDSGALRKLLSPLF